MPFGRYFAFVGGMLLALLFAIDWYEPHSVAGPARTDVDRSTIRIYSGHKWPSAVVFDTSQPTIVPAATAQAAEPAPAAAPLNALAMVQPPEPAARPVAPAAAPKRAVRRVKVARSHAPRVPSYGMAPHVASYDMFGFRNSFPTGW
jgi:hypothetical protein